MFIYLIFLIFMSIGGVFFEWGGIVNVGFEGMMIIGVFSFVVFNLIIVGMFGSMILWFLIFFGVLIGVFFFFFYVVVMVNLSVDYIVFGIVFNLMVLVFGVFLF